MENFRISGNPASGDGLLLDGINEVLVHGLSVDHNGGHGVNLLDCYEDPRIANSIFTYNKQAGVNIQGGHDLVIIGNQFEENEDALRCRDSFNLTFNGNNIDEAVRAAGECQRIVVTGNVMTDLHRLAPGRKPAIALGRATASIVKDNAIEAGFE